MLLAVKGFRSKHVNFQDLTFIFWGIFFWAPTSVNRYEIQSGHGQKMYILYAESEKYFDKLWLKDRLIEMENLGYSINDMQMLYILHKNT